MRSHAIAFVAHAAALHAPARLRRIDAAPARLRRIDAEPRAPSARVASMRHSAMRHRVARVEPLRATAATGEWTTWALLSSAGALGLWAEESTQWGAALSSNVVSMVSALLLVNVGALPAESPVSRTSVEKSSRDLDCLRKLSTACSHPFVPG